MKYILAAPMFLALAAASAPPVSVLAATGEWSNLPPMVDRGAGRLSNDLILALDDIATRHECALPGYSQDRFDFNMSFAAAFDGDGNLMQIIIPKLDCPKAEAVIGGALKEMIQRGVYKPVKGAPTAWYRGDLSFELDEAKH